MRGDKPQLIALTYRSHDPLSLFLLSRRLSAMVKEDLARGMESISRAVKRRGLHKEP